MVGKGTLLVILGFSLIFGLASNYWNRESTEAVDNFVQYYNETAAHNMAVSGANVALSSVFLNPSNNSTRQINGTLYDGSYSVSIDSTGPYKLAAVSTGTYEGTTATIRVVMGPNYFNTYGIYTATMNGVYWATGDTVRGDFYSGDHFNVMGSPVFYGSVSAYYGPYSPQTSQYDPKIYGPTDWGVNIPMPNTSVSNVAAAAANGGFQFNNLNSGRAYDVYMTFTASSSGTNVTYHTNLNLTDTTVALSSLAPNGVIMVNNGNLHVHGTVNGQVTVGATTSTSKYGNVYIDGNVMCNTDPRTNPNSGDAIGIVALNNVTVESDNAYNGVSPPNPPVNPTIEAAIFAQNGTFQSYYQQNDDYLLSNLGAVHVYGSIANHQLGATSDQGITHGYNANYNWDSRFKSIKPPYYPTTGTYRIVSWYE